MVNGSKLQKIGQSASKIAFSLPVILTVVFSMGALSTRAQASQNWIRHDIKNHGVIIFVHGITGDARDTWKSESGSYWPEMLAHDPAFDGQDIYVYEYRSPHFDHALSIDELAENMRLILYTDGVLQHDELTFVSHSMGGIVTRAFVLRYKDSVAPKVRLLYFFATPTSGNQYAYIVSHLSKNPQFEQLSPMQADTYLAWLQKSWLAADLSINIKSYCGYETETYLGVKVVDLPSATSLCNKRVDPVEANHSTIVKPQNYNSESYRALKEAFQETVAATPKPQHKGRAASPASYNSAPTAQPILCEITQSSNGGVFSMVGDYDNQISNVDTGMMSMIDSSRNVINGVHTNGLSIALQMPTSFHSEDLRACVSKISGEIQNWILSGEGRMRVINNFLIPSPFGSDTPELEKWQEHQKQIKTEQMAGFWDGAIREFNNQILLSVGKLSIALQKCGVDTAEINKSLNVTVFKGSYEDFSGFEPAQRLSHDLGHAADKIAPNVTCPVSGGS